MADDVVLREVTDADLPTLYEQQREHGSNWMAAFPHREYDEFMAHWAKIRVEPSVVVRSVVADGEVAGNVLSFVHKGLREVGYWLGSPYWGRGIASRALELFLVELTERPLYAGTAHDNAGSLRVLQKCGFAVIGEQPEYSSVRGETIAMVILRLDARSEPTGA